jgi:hypothetical protein
MVDATSGDIIRKMPDAHAPQTAVLHLRFTFLNNLALCGDSSGCVFSLSFNRRLGVRSWDSKCLFSGARGEVCVFEPLVQGHDLHFLTHHILVAMATLSKVNHRSTLSKSSSDAVLGDRNIDSAETEGPLQSAVAQSVDVAAVDLVAVGVGGTDVSAGARLGALQRTQLHQSGPAQHQQQPIETSAVEKRPVELHPHGDPLVGDQTLGAARHQRELAIGGGEDAAGVGSFGTGQRRFGLQFCAL